MRVFAIAATMLCATAVSASAQKAITAKDLAGTWKIQAMIGPKDSVVATNTTRNKSDGTATVQFPKRPPIESRTLTMGGDSVVSEVGPYQSILRPGVMVTTQTIAHVKGNDMTGTFVAVYSTGDTLRGKISGKKQTGMHAR
jgi:hypothetical protein